MSREVQNPTRRHFLTLIGVGAASAVSVSLVGCGGARCDESPELSPAESQMRTQLRYEMRGPDPSKRCNRCALYTAPTGDAECGGCQLNLGPVHPDGTCTSFQPRA